MTESISLENLVPASSIQQSITDTSEQIKTCLAPTSDSSSYILEQVQQYPTLQALANKVMAKVSSFQEAAGEILDLLDAEPLMASAYQAHARGGVVSASEFNAPLDLGALNSTTNKLKQVADLSDVLSDLQAVSNDQQLLSNLRSLTSQSEARVDVNEIVGALESVQTHGLQINVISTIIALLDAREENALSQDVKDVLNHVESELNAIVASLQSHLPRFLDLTRSILNGAFA